MLKFFSAVHLVAGAALYALALRMDVSLPAPAVPGYEPARAERVYNLQRAAARAETMGAAHAAWLAGILLGCAAAVCARIDAPASRTEERAAPAQRPRSRAA